MAKWKALAIDVDQTLLDFDACSAWCIEQGFRDWNLKFEDHIPGVFKVVNDEMWRQMETGELEHERFLKTRWQTIFDQLGMSHLDGPAFEDLFRSYLNQSHIPIAGALEAVPVLAEHYPLYVVSNGPAWQQHNRLTKAGMREHFQRLFTSQELGVKKPDPLFFSQAFDLIREDIPDIQSDEILLIGDSVTADVQGALQAGWTPLWFGPAGSSQNQVDESSSPDTRLADVSRAADWKEVLEFLNLSKSEN